MNLVPIFCFVLGWLEPLLSRISEDYRHVVYPQIAQISDETLKFKAFPAKDIQVGKFDWNLIFRWMIPPESIQKLRKKLIDPVRLVVSCLLIDKLYCFRL